MSVRENILRQLRALPLPRQTVHEPLPLESEAFRVLFPAGLPRGTLTEWLSDGLENGTESLLLKLVAELRRTLVVIDAEHNFYPPAAAALGVPLSETIVVRPRQEADVLWAVEQSLRCPGVGLVLTRLNHLEDRPFRRLQLAAEHGGTIGLFIRPTRELAAPSWAQARFLVRALPSRPVGRRLQIESLHLHARDVVELELNDATSDVRLVSRLADSAVLRRAAGA